MFRFLLRRFFYGILVLFGVITVVFLLFNILPGDPARMMMGQRADISSVENIRKDLGLDKPAWQQYLNFINDLSPVSVHNTDINSFWYYDKDKYTGKHIKAGVNTIIAFKKPYLRKSYQSNRKVSQIISEAFPKTLLLAGVSILIAAILGIFTGILAALYKNSLFDRLSLVLSVFGMSLPSFFAAILMAWIFAYVLGDITGLNMVGSLFSVDDFGEGEYLDLKNLILPAITLGIRPLAIIIELTKSSVLEVQSQDFIRTAKAKGLPASRVIMRHTLRNALNPVITAISGWFASLMAGAVFVEYVFDWKGIGVVIVDALEKYDFPLIMGCVLFISVILVAVNILVDIIYAMLDPRVRLS